MESLLNDQMRLLVLVGLCGLLWSVESIVPLYRNQNSRLRHALPNVALTLILVLTNLALSFSSAYLAGLTVRNGIGVFFLFGLSAGPQAVLGVVALDLFAYFAHVLLHKSWLGWQFHRVHHSENAVDVTTAFRQHPGETVWRMLWQLAAVFLLKAVSSRSSTNVAATCRKLVRDSSLLMPTALRSIVAPIASISRYRAFAGSQFLELPCRLISSYDESALSY